MESVTNIIDDWIAYQIVTLWIKHRKAYKKEYIETFEDWLFNHTKNWGACDILCYRILNPMVERFPSLFNEKVLTWAKAEKTYVKRASAVCLLESTQSFKVNVSYEKVKKIVDLLISDGEPHIQKGIGWLLKYAYLSYPEKTIEYLKKNVKN
ncbi:MAG: DNA alkylation repair protein [Candidatus Cloacimonadia bacterium]